MICRRRVLCGANGGRRETYKAEAVYAVVGEGCGARGEVVNRAVSGIGEGGPGARNVCCAVVAWVGGAGAWKGNDFDLWQGENGWCEVEEGYNCLCSERMCHCELPGCARWRREEATRG